MQQFKLGDVVEWSSHSQGFHKKKNGIIVQIVLPGNRPDRSRFESLYKGAQCGMGRKVESYVVQVGSKYYWPVVSILKVIQ